jgi:exoribonuclease R
VALTGTIRPHRRGFGFVDLDAPTEGPNGPEDTLFVPPPALVDLVDGDRVVCEAVDDGRGKGLTAEDVVVLRRTRRLLAGTLVERQGRLVLRPDPSLANRDWIVPDDVLPPGTKAGQGCVLTVAEAAVDGSLRRCGALVAGPVAESSWRWLRLLAATRHLGAIDRTDPALAADADDALAADLSADPGAEADGPAPPPAPDVEPGPDPLAALRVDRSGEPCCTIDGPSTRDLDDAVSATRLPDGATRISVHIAVARATALVRRARTRATTTYLPSGAWPMLPRSLSEGSLSLRPGGRRRAVTVAFTVDAGGGVEGIEVSASLVRSSARLTYAQVEGWLTGEAAPGADEGDDVTPDVDVPEEVRSIVFAAHEAAERIGAARLARGAGYETDPGSHFGLASGAYVHFTSPIRRYADLVVHRAVHAVLLGDPAGGPTGDELGRLAGWLDHRAGATARAERAELRLLWADVLQRTVAGGRPYTTTALIGAVRRAGLRVRVDRFDLVGTVPAAALAPGNVQAYVQAPDELSATVGEATYHVGDRIRVAVDEADRATGDLTFAPAAS